MSDANARTYVKLITKASDDLDEEESRERFYKILIHVDSKRTEEEIQILHKLLRIAVCSPDYGQIVEWDGLEMSVVTAKELSERHGEYKIVVITLFEKKLYFNDDCIILCMNSERIPGEWSDCLFLRSEPALAICRDRELCGVIDCPQKVTITANRVDEKIHAKNKTEIDNPREHYANVIFNCLKPPNKQKDMIHNGIPLLRPAETLAFLRQFASGRKNLLQLGLQIAMDVDEANASVGGKG
ncbi:MAG TPA: hypothetical protein PLI09_03825 [Candidatus Hydrogenedentes bacterium]|nr:hypothetical protein [Candidatus Hydrogenedentota bacterium]